MKLHCKATMTINLERKNLLSLITAMAFIFFYQIHQHQLVSCQQQRHLAGSSFPGVSKDLGSFCASRPSLPIDLASMIVHVKRNVSFNYKLYLFSGDHVFQTGQVIPRDDFRVHSFPVRVKKFQEFWPLNMSGHSERFDLKEFFRLVPSDEPIGRSSKRARHVLPDDAGGDPLPGDKTPTTDHGEPFISHDVAHVVAERQQRRSTTTNEGANLNKFIEFDRDDQITRLNADPSSFLRSPESHKSRQTSEPIKQEPTFDQLVLPVGSFSSFHVNLTYFVRKDFDQVDPQLVKVLVDANKFQVSHWEVIDPKATDNSSSNNDGSDFAFLFHKMLRDTNTRITSINQIYEDWITRNFYTIVYVQRRLFMDDQSHDGETIETSEDQDDKQHQEVKERATKKDKSVQLINDRLIFRGSSMTLIGADQLDYQVKAAAFITEKNGLHYYIEFLNTGKFYLCAVDWQKRPFKIIDWQQFPIKPTKTQFDNEELLLCPPAVCYSNQPVDEIVSYGRLDLSEHIQRLINVRLSANHLQVHEKTLTSARWTVSRDSSTISRGQDGFLSSEPISHRDSRSNLNQIVEAVKMSTMKAHGPGGQMAVKLHLRDWVWHLGIINGSFEKKLTDRRYDNNAQPVSTFSWRYELAKRNDIKAKPDAYGYTLIGHEIDASYRIFNELYLISANHLIAINYTLANETVVSSVLVSEEFPGLVSSLIDPITGAFYDRDTNRLYFIKGDRYIGFDYATRKPLEDFILKPSYLHTAIWAGSDGATDVDNTNHQPGPQLLSSLPVLGLLGRQDQVDAIYHDLATDLVYIFTGMKFYTFHASEFKNGAFKTETGELPQMFCINEQFLDGCKFDKAYPNPCQSDAKFHKSHRSSAKLMEPKQAAGSDEDDGSAIVEDSLENFNQRQQMKLRSIASKAGLLNVLVENTLMARGMRTLEPLMDVATPEMDFGRDQNKLLIYLLMAIVVVIILVTIALILVMVNSNSAKCSRSQRAVLDQLNSSQLPRHTADKMVTAQAIKQAPSRHLSNHHAHLRPYHVPHIQATYNRSSAPKPSSGSSINMVMSKGRLYRDDIDNSVL